MAFNVLVSPEKVEEKTKAGLYLPDEHREREQFAQKRGVLVAKSPLSFSYAKWPASEHPKVGDTVLFAKYQAETVEGADGETYWMMKDEAIAGVLNND